MKHYTNTFSICCLDPQTGEAGIAVASKVLAVGVAVSYARAGVGVVATQAGSRASYGIRGLDLLQRGVSAQQVVDRLTAEDVTVDTWSEEKEQALRAAQRVEGEDFLVDRANGRLVRFTSRERQLGIVDRNGSAATFNGARISEWAGSASGPGYCCQGNTLAGEGVIRAMENTFLQYRDRGARMVTQLFAALKAADGEGGDSRGKQSAALLVARHGGHWTGSDRYCDLRVDDHDDPIAELERILVKHAKHFHFAL